MKRAFFRTLIGAAAAGAGGPVSSGNWFFASAFSAPPGDRYNTTTALRPNLAGRARHMIGSGARSKLRLMMPNWSVGSGGNNLSAYIVGAWLEANGTSARITFNGGSNSATMTAGQSKLVSDDILPASFGLSSFDRGLECWIRLEVRAATGVNRIILSKRYNPHASNKMIEFDPATTTINTSGTGTLAATSGSDWANYTSGGLTEIAGTLIGTFVGADEPVWVEVGDSIPTGDGDQLNSFTDIAGYFQKSMFDADLTSNPVANFKMSVSGYRWANFNPLSAYLIDWLAYANRGLEALGTNDFGKDTGTLINLATAQASAQTLWGIFNSAGIGSDHLYRTDLLCSTSGTFTSEAGQTVKPGWGAGGNPELFNSWTDTLVGTMLAGKIRFTAPYGTDIYKWAANATGDGVHPVAATHNSMAGEFRTLRLAA